MNIEPKRCPTCGQVTNLQSLGGQARTKKMTGKERREHCRMMAKKRWAKSKPAAEITAE